MRTRDALERLAAAGSPLLAQADALVDAAEADRILERIVATNRLSPARRTSRRAALVLVGAAALAVAATAAVLEGGRGAAPAPPSAGHHPVALTGPRIELAGYHFRTPAGFKASKSGCLSAPAAGMPRPASDGFAAAAAADGACVEAVDVVAGDWLQSHDPIPDSATAVDIGRYTGYYVAPQASGGESSLYVNLPHADAGRVVYLLLVGRGVSEDELIAIAVSGLPTLPPLGPTSTTGTEPTG